MIRVFFRYKGRTILNAVDFESRCEAQKFMRNHDHEYEYLTSINYSDFGSPYDSLNLDVSAFIDIDEV